MANVQECPSASNTYFAEVMFDIAPDGAVENARLVRSNSDCFGQKALDAIRSTEYAGFEKDGQPVRYTNMTRSYQIKRFQRPLTLPARD
ncbi:MAG: energy transducer TonB [Parvularculaceae bacterium]|nr:energy transducer TonB [Parvularculaceae bacterium]